MEFTILDEIQSVSFTISENKCVKQRRINTLDSILVVVAGGFVSSFLREVQSTIDRVVLTHGSFITGQLPMPCTWKAT